MKAVVGMIREIVILALIATPLGAQATPYLPLDDPRLPLIAHLIVRGVLADPSPMVRPFLLGELRAALAAASADSTTSSGRLVAELRRAFAEADSTLGESWWSVEARGGGQAFTSARRDLLHPAGGKAIRAYADLTFTGAFGRLIGVSRVAAENRLKLDPDWPGPSAQRFRKQNYRFIEAYFSAQLGRVRLHFGQVDRNWGPTGIPGIPISDFGYPRPDLSLEIRTRTLLFQWLAAVLRDETDSTGARIHRYFMAHRLSLQVTRNLRLGAWETSVLAGVDQGFDPSFYNPLTLLTFGSQFGRSSNYNVMLGGDLSWRPSPRLLVEAQGALDDWRWSTNTSIGETPRPNRWGFAGALSGPLGGAAAWRFTASGASSLAFRTIEPTENFIDGGVGIGRGFADNATISLAASIPVRARWLVAPDLTVLWQGEGRLNDPFPRDQALSNSAEWFLGRTSVTYRLGLGVSGQEGRLGVSANGGIHRVTHADHVTGRTRTRFEGRLTATYGISARGPIR